MDKQNNGVEEILDIIAELFPTTAEKISTVGFVNWQNIVNHATLESLSPKEVLFIADLILALAISYADQEKFKPDIQGGIPESSFDDALDFLQE